MHLSHLSAALNSLCKERHLYATSEVPPFRCKFGIRLFSYVNCSVHLIANISCLYGSSIIREIRLKHCPCNLHLDSMFIHLFANHVYYQYRANFHQGHCFSTLKPLQHPPTSTHYYESTSPLEVWDLLVSDASWYHHKIKIKNNKITLQNSLVHRSWLVEWSPPHLDCWIPVNLQATTENASLSTLLKKKLNLSLLPLLACAYLNNAWDLMLRALVFWFIDLLHLLSVWTKEIKAIIFFSIAYIHCDESNCIA